MHRTLFPIPREVFEPQDFGFSWLLLGWAVFSVVLLIWVVRKQGFSADTWGHVLLLLLVGALIHFVLPALCNADGLPIHGFGVMLLLGIVSGVAMAVWRGRRVGIAPELIFTLALWAFVPGIIGARAFYVIEYWSRFQTGSIATRLVAMINITEGGIVFYGSAIGGAIGLAAFLAKYKMPPLATLDLIAPSVLVGLAIGRIGCLLNGCCFGGTCDLPWAVTFPAASPPYSAQVERGQMYGMRLSGNPGAEPRLLSVDPDSPAGKAGLRAGDRLQSIGGRRLTSAGQAHRILAELFRANKPVIIEAENRSPVTLPAVPIPPRSLPVHPTQLYSALNALLLCLFLVAYTPFRRRDGEVAAMFLTVYPVTRFLLEIIRTDEADVFGTGMSISQNVSLLLLVGAIIFWAILRRKPPGTAFATYQESSKKGSGSTSAA